MFGRATAAYLAAGQDAEVIYLVPLSPTQSFSVSIAETNNGKGANYTDYRILCPFLWVSNSMME